MFSINSALSTPKRLNNWFSNSISFSRIEFKTSKPAGVRLMIYDLRLSGSIVWVI